MSSFLGFLLESEKIANKIAAEIDLVTKAKTAGRPTPQCNCGECVSLRQQGIEDYNPNDPAHSPRPKPLTPPTWTKAAGMDKVAREFGSTHRASHLSLVADSIVECLNESHRSYRNFREFNDRINACHVEHDHYKALSLMERVKLAARQTQKIYNRSKHAYSVMVAAQTAHNNLTEHKKHLEMMLVSAVCDAEKEGTLKGDCLRFATVDGYVIVERKPGMEWTVRYTNTDPVTIPV